MGSRVEKGTKGCGPKLLKEIITFRLLVFTSGREGFVSDNMKNLTLFRGLRSNSFQLYNEKSGKGFGFNKLPDSLPLHTSKTIDYNRTEKDLFL